MRGRPRVGLLVQSTFAYGRKVLQGIGAYIRQAGPWLVYHRSGELPMRLPPGFRSWRPEGVIAQLESPAIVAQVRRLGIPVVDVLGIHRVRGIPRMRDDHAAIGRLAAEYFLERGYKHFAYCGTEGVFYCEERCRSFVHFLQEQGHKVFVYKTRPPADVVGVRNREAAGQFDIPGIGRWLRELPRPLAVMAGSDVRAQQVLSACHEEGVAVPEEAAVLGVGNDEVLCHLCAPVLSSIQLNAERIGYEAAALLDRMMRGRRSGKMEFLFPPVGIVSRGSTAELAVADPDLAAALQFIREHYTDAIGVEDVAQYVAMSRSTLQRRFLTCLHRTPHDEILRVRIQRVRELVASTDLPLEKIADLVGYEHLETMCKQFKQKTGYTPGQYRKISRL